MSGWGLPRHKHAHVLAVSNICVHCELEVASVVLARAAMASGKQEPVLKGEEGPEETPPFGVVEVKGGVPSGKAPFVFMNSVPKQKASGKTPPWPFSASFPDAHSRKKSNLPHAEEEVSKGRRIGTDSRASSFPFTHDRRTEVKDCRRKKDT